MYDIDKSANTSAVEVNLYEAEAHSAFGSSFADTLRGGSGSDTLEGGSGADLIWGSGGSDILIDSSGTNMFWWTDSDNNDVIQSSGQGSVMNFWDFGFADRTGGFMSDGSLWMAKNGGSYSVTLSNWLNQDSATRIQSFVFAENGVNKTYAWNNGKDVEVNLGSDAYRCAASQYLECADYSNAILRGSSLSDTIIGGFGNDQIWGGYGGSDVLTGGAGADTYWWDYGDGNDTIAYESTNSSDTVKLYTSNAGSVTAVSSADSLNDSLVLTAGNDTLTIFGWSKSKLNTLQYADGSTVKIDSLLFTSTTSSNHKFNIQVDYSKDTSGFYTTYLKSLVEKACNYWEDRITTDVASTASGTQYNFNGFLSGTTTDTTDDLTIVMSSFYEISNVYGFSSEDSNLWDNNNLHFYAKVGLIEMNSAWIWDMDGNVTYGENSYFEQVVAHEIGHILGLSNPNSIAYKANLSDDNFIGSNGEDVNGGQSIKLMSIFDYHLYSNYCSLMTQYAESQAASPTSLDYAMLKDIGYTVVS